MQQPRADEEGRAAGERRAREEARRLDEAELDEDERRVPGCCLFVCCCFVRIERVERTGRLEAGCFFSLSLCDT